MEVETIRIRVHRNTQPHSYVYSATAYCVLSAGRPHLETHGFGDTRKDARRMAMGKLEDRLDLEPNE